MFLYLSAENVAKQWGITREAQDQFALTSQQRCEAAQKDDAFIEEITPVTIVGRKGKNSIMRTCDKCDLIQRFQLSEHLKQGFIVYCTQVQCF